MQDLQRVGTSQCRTRAVLERLKARVARRPGRWQRRMGPPPERASAMCRRELVAAA
jgi:hypothetical protein